LSKTRCKGARRDPNRKRGGTGTVGFGLFGNGG
jgi:hypothetical protein